jgi:hypothetical protein
MTEGLGDAFDLDVAAAMLRSDQSDVQVLLKMLARTLSGALGERLVVERKGRGLLKRSDEIRSLKVTMGDEQYEAVVDGTSVATSIGKVSGGIRIRTERISVEDWIKRLLAALQAEAAHSFAARQALENIVIGGPQ